MPRQGSNGAHPALRRARAGRSERTGAPRENAHTKVSPVTSPRTGGARWAAARIGGGVAGAALGRLASRLLAPLSRRTARRLGLPQNAVAWLVQTVMPVVTSLAAERLAVRRRRRADRRDAIPRHGRGRGTRRPHGSRERHGPRRRGEPPVPGHAPPSRDPGGRGRRTAKVSKRTLTSLSPAARR
ncbi:hypothetical protein Arub01_05800 [Actinomadura rubrobrunea]|uniref:Uncharacterized protein n=1 Tax=Actinomadura rubrobrunea TaxID=115335 RepID=A0A9W6PSC4_9ACTN|nr:hypothetical protein Arub01_05800 [Actinomadura rubrobrunea]